MLQLVYRSYNPVEKCDNRPLRGATLPMFRTLVKDFTRKHLGTGLATAIGRLVFELRVLVLHRSSIRKAKRLLGTATVKLNCGCGPMVKAGWVNIDISKDADLQLDLRKRLPFPDNSVAFIYSEHFFEHLEYPGDTEVFLTESVRVLIPGGQFRVGVPDTEWPLNAYVNGDDRYFESVRDRFWAAACYCETRMDVINFHFRQFSEHKYAYDYETLAKALLQAGFVRIERSEFDSSLDSESRANGTLYVNAWKMNVPAQENLASTPRHAFARRSNHND